MHVGSVSHSFGTSRLWHDANVEILKDYRTVPVQKSLDELELPKEEHVLPPEKKADPYTVQEQAYDVAAQQMARGVEGQKLLHGTRANAAAFDAAVSAARERAVMEDVTRTLVVAPHQPPQAPQPTGNVRPQDVAPVVPGQVSAAGGAAHTSAEREGLRAARDALDSSNLVDAAALGAGVLASAATAVKGAAAPVGAAQAAAAVTASTGAASATATAATVANRDDPADSPFIADAGRAGRG